MEKKIKILFIAMLSCLFISNIQAQLFPVQVNQSIIPPYSTKLNSYATATDVKLRLYLTLTDININNRQVRLKLKIKGNGLDVQSTEFVTGAPQIFLNGGTQQQFTNVDLAAYFELQNLVGINTAQYNRPLPDGVYSFCWEVYDLFTNQLISNSALGCSTVYLLLNDPPILNIPQRGEQITQQAINNIIFQWTPRHANATNVSYEFELRELWDRQIDPQAGFLSSPNYYTATTRATTLLYNSGKPELFPDKIYAWCVRAISSSGISENAVFKNNGFSEIYYFTLNNNCSPPLFPLSEAVSTQRVKITWQTNPDHNKYHVQYKRSDISDAEWFEVFTHNTMVQISNLKPGATYDFRVGGTCNDLTDLEPSYVYSSTNQFSMPTSEETVSYNCGIVPEIEISNTTPLANIGVNETFTAGDFPVTVKWIESGNGVFSGKGYIVVPYLADTKLAVEFKNIKINTDYQLFDGIIKTSYDKTWGSVSSTGGLTSGGAGVSKNTVFKFPIEEIKIGPNGGVLVVGKGGAPVVELPAGEDYTITDSGDPSTDPPTPPKSWAVDEEGNITPLGDTAEGGSSTAANTNGVNSNGEANAITAKDITVTFTKASNNRYGFDAYNSSQKHTKNLYKTLGDDYYMPYKAVAKGRDDFIIANFDITNDSIKPHHIIFKTKEGVSLVKTDSTKTSYTLKLRGTFDDADIETHAVIEQDGKYQIAGAFIQYQIAPKTVDVVLVNSIGVDKENITSRLNTIYKQANVSINLIEINNFDINKYVTGNTIASGESGFLANYTSQQQDINTALKSRNDYNQNAYYLILTNKKPSTANEKGLMPIGRQFGYIYDGSALTVAHELGHGAFQLKHPFSKNSYSYTKNSTDWLLDYGNGEQLPYDHWKAIHNPKIRLGIFDSDDEGESNSLGNAKKLNEHIIAKMKELGNNLKSDIILVVHCEDCSKSESISSTSNPKFEPISLDGQFPVVPFKNKNLALENAERVIYDNGITCMNLYYSNKNAQPKDEIKIKKLFDSNSYDARTGIWVYDDEAYEYDCSDLERPWGSDVCQSSMINQTYISKLFDLIKKCEPPFKDILVDRIKKSKLKYNFYDKGMESWVNGDDPIPMVFDYTGNNLVVKAEDFTEKIEEFLAKIALPSCNEAIYFAITDESTTQADLNVFYQKGQNIDTSLIEGELHITRVEIQFDAFGEVTVKENTDIAELIERANTFEKRYISIFRKSNIILNNTKEDVAKRYATNFMSSFDKDGLKENISDSSFSHIFDNVFSVETTNNIVKTYLRSGYTDNARIDITIDTNVNGEVDIIYLINQIVKHKSKTEAQILYDEIFPVDGFNEGYLRQFVDQFSGVDVFVADGNYEHLSKAIRDLWIKVNPEYEANENLISKLQESNKVFPIGVHGAFASDQGTCTPHFVSPDFGDYSIKVSLPKGVPISKIINTNRSTSIHTYCDTKVYNVTVANYAEPVALRVTSPIKVGGKEQSKGKTIIVPAFMLFQIKDEQLNKRIATYIEVGADVALTFTGVGNLTKIKHLSKVTKIKNLIAIYEVASATTDIAARISTDVLTRDNKISLQQAEKIKSVTGTLAALSGVAELGVNGRKLFLNFIEKSEDYATATKDFKKARENLDQNQELYNDLSKLFNVAEDLADAVDEFVEGVVNGVRRYNVAGEIADGVTTITRQLSNNGNTITLKWVVDGNGVITFGNRSNLATILGTIDDEAHHILTWTKSGSHSVVQAAAKDGFHLNTFENGIGLSKYRKSLGEGMHGNHPAYDDYVVHKLSEFKRDFPNFTPESANQHIQNNIIPHMEDLIEDASNSVHNLNEYFKQVVNPSLGTPLLTQ